MYGAQRSLLDAVIGLRECGHEVHVAVPRLGALSDELAKAGIPVHCLKYQLWIPGANSSTRLHAVRALFGVIFRLREHILFLRRGGFEVVYTNTVTVLEFALAARIASLRHVWHIRESASGNPQLVCLFSNRVVGLITSLLSESVIFNSQYTRDRYSRATDSGSLIVYNGFRVPESVLPHRPAGACFRILSIGYMDRRKGLDVLLSALDVLPASLLRQVRLTIAGGIEERYRSTAIEPLLVRLGGRAEINLLGWVDDVRPLLLSHDVLVSSAREEPFGRTLVEAMAHQLPVIATKSGGPEEIVVDEVTGLLVESESAVDLAGAIERLMRSGVVRLEMATAGRARAIQRFSLTRYVSDLASVLK
jgi:glycosyltransferase involved in cell wall biosynthesis